MKSLSLYAREVAQQGSEGVTLAQKLSDRKVNRREKSLEGAHEQGRGQCYSRQSKWHCDMVHSGDWRSHWQALQLIPIIKCQSLNRADQHWFTRVLKQFRDWILLNVIILIVLFFHQSFCLHHCSKKKKVGTNFTTNIIYWLHNISADTHSNHNCALWKLSNLWLAVTGPVHPRTLAPITQQQAVAQCFFGHSHTNSPSSRPLVHQPQQH